MLITGGPLDRCFARAIFVVNPAGKLTYVEYVPEISAHPNYDAAPGCREGLIQKPFERCKSASLIPNGPPFLADCVLPSEFPLSNQISGSRSPAHVKLISNRKVCLNGRNYQTARDLTSLRPFLPTEILDVAAENFRYRW